MDEALLDTDILSEVLKRKDQQVLATAREYLAEYQRLAFSAMTVYEVIRGMRSRRATRQLAEFLKTVDTSDIFPVSLNSTSPDSCEASAREPFPGGFRVNWEEIPDEVRGVCPRQTSRPTGTASRRNANFRCRVELSDLLCSLDCRVLACARRGRVAVSFPLSLVAAGANQRSFQQ